MNRRTRATIESLSVAVFSVLLLCCCGCVHRKLSIRGTYRVEENAGYPLLVPSFAPDVLQGDFQIGNVTLQGHSPVMDSELRQRCRINGDIFSFHPGSPSDSNHWIIKSLSMQGWNRRGGEVNVEALWKLFTHDLIRMEQQGCFPSDENLFSIQRAIAQAIPLPATETPLFFFSFDNVGFVDLAPGMEIKIEKTLLVPGVGKDSAVHYQGSLYARYKIVSSPRNGVALHLSSTAKRKIHLLSANESVIFNLSDHFASKRMIRLFLEKSSVGSAARNAMILGASNVRDLDTATLNIQRDGTQGCVDHDSAVDCLVFENGTVSLLLSIWINGRLLSYPFETRLMVILDRLPRDEQARALASVRVRRRLAMGDYAEIVFPKTLEGAGQVILLPGDRVQWQQ